MSTASIDRLVQAHNAIRDARAARRRAYDEADALLETDQKMLKAVMLDMLNKAGAKSINTEKGTVYRREVLKPSAADWGAIWDWAKANDAMDIFEKRLKVGFIQEYMEANDGALPPGINAHREFEVSVRLPSNKPTSAPGAPIGE